MDLHLGKPIKEGMETETVDFQKLFPMLRQHKLNGYMSMDLMTSNGMEEATLLFREGEIIAAEYIYLAKEKTLYGEEALKQSFNACLGKGTFDIHELQEEEIIAGREMNRQTVLKYKPSDKEIIEMIPESFQDKSLEEKRAEAALKAEAIKKSGGISREDVLKKYGINHPDDHMLDALLGDVVK
jgi:hypothetical protein